LLTVIQGAEKSSRGRDHPPQSKNRGPVKISREKSDGNMSLLGSSDRCRNNRTTRKTGKAKKFGVVPGTRQMVAIRAFSSLFQKSVHCWKK
jgi:hypothetical protein